MANEETVIAVNFKLSLIYHDNHYKHVVQICNQYLQNTNNDKAYFDLFDLLM